MIHLRLLGPLSLSAADGSEVRAVITQPKRLALLSYLAAAGEGSFKRRDALLALFWPESNERQARLALRQALYHLRNALGPEVITNRGDDELAIEPGTLLCDAREFQRLLHEGELDGALELYRGDFLEGFSIAGISVELEEWLEAERATLRAMAAEAAATLAERTADSGELATAVLWARRGLSLSPGDESMLRRLLTLLKLRGDRGGALRTAEHFARRIRDELGTTLSSETQQVIADLRAGETAPGGRDQRTNDVPSAAGEQSTESAEALPAGAAQPSAEAGHASASAQAEPPAPVPVRAPGHSRAADARDRESVWRTGVGAGRRAAMAAAASIVLAAVIAIGAVRLHAERSAPPVLAVGWMEVGDHVGYGGGAQLLPALLETALDEIPGQRTVSDARLHDLLGQMGDRDASDSTLVRAARLAGATELLEGNVRRTGDDRLRLDLRRVRLADGVVLRSYHVSGASAFDLAHDAAASVAADLELPTPASRPPESMSTSLVARRFFEEGLRTYYQVDVPRATPFFVAALREDSTCAMCAYYASLSESSDAAKKLAYARTSVRLAERASERERLYIRSTWARFSGAGELLATARKLVRRYPSDPEAHLRVGAALSNTGRFLEALPHLRRVIEMDSLALRGGSPHCRACDAEKMLVTSYWLLDAFPAAELAAREWIARQPTSRSAWSALAETYARMGSFPEARAALDSVSKFSAGDSETGAARTRLAIRSGDFESADAHLRYRLRSGTPYERREAIWWLAISLRNQGRIRAAFELMDVPPPARDSANREIARYGWLMARGQLLFELRRFREGAAVYRGLAEDRPAAIRELRPVVARHRSWALLHEGDALAAAGDTVALPGLIDSVEVIGAASEIGRDKLSYHHLRGLLLAARGDRAGAEAEFRAAIFSTTEGYLRTSLELARLLLADDRPRDAIPLLRSALHGPLEGNGLYVTRAELQELLGDAFRAVGEADSAAVYYRAVVRAWAHGDPPFAARAARARRILEGR
jgi:DNA-binding SARP family transcriptional activator